MRDSEFLQANKVFTGQLRILCKIGKDTSKVRKPVTKADLKKMYDFVCSNLDNPSMLQYKVYLDIAFYMGCCGNEGLRELTTKSFEVKNSPEGHRYMVMTHKEMTKKSQGDECTNNKNIFKSENNNVIVEQPGNPRCPISSFEKYLSRVDHSIDALFQQPKKNIHPKYDEKQESFWKGDNCPVSENTIN